MRPSDIEALGGVAPILAVIFAWREFRRNHDVEDAKVCCCKHTQKLFATLDELEKEVLDL